MNTGLRYYREYYRQVDLRPEYQEDQKTRNKEEVATVNKKLMKTSLFDLQSALLISENELINSRFALKTTYPGLLAGSGYLHEFKIEDALMLGFSFDHTSGLPVIPGSSIKGLLRFACKAEKGAYFRQLLQEIRPDLKAVDYEQFINAVFEGKEGEKPLRINRRDVFFDAVPVRSHHPEQHFLGEDYITPHLHRDDRSMDGLKNPIPLKFLKILPEVVFEFRFLLRGEKAGISATDREKIFRQILLDLGIGAKTNVGYGQFVEETAAERVAAGKLAEQMQQQILQQQEEARIKKETAVQAEKDKDFQNNFQEIKPELPPDKEKETVDGTIFRKAGTKYFIRYEVNGKTCEKMRLRKHFKELQKNPEEGDAVTVTIRRDSNNNGLSIQITKKN